MTGAAIQALAIAPSEEGVLPQPSLSQDLLSMADLHRRSPEVVRRPVTR